MNKLSLIMLATIALSGCGSTNRLPSKFDLPVQGITHAEAVGSKQKFVLCAICPRPTPKTLALPTEVVAADASAQDGQATPQQPAALPKFTYVPPPAVPAAQSKFIIPFAYNSATLGPRGKAAAAEMLTKLEGMDPKDYSDIIVHGFTDDLGSTKYNDQLGLRRANTVLKEIRKSNIKLPASAMADGECCFVSDNSDEQQRAPNRRVEVVLVKRR